MAIKYFLLFFIVIGVILFFIDRSQRRLVTLPQALPLIRTPKCPPVVTPRQ